MNNKVILREDLHKQFETLLERIQPKEKLIKEFQNVIQQKIKERDKDRDLIIRNYINRAAISRGITVKSCTIDCNIMIAREINRAAR